jgi:hypothetical protein
MANFYQYNGSTYILSNSATWQQAQAEAQSLGGNLVTINNQAEQNWLITTFGSSEELWIGLTDQVIEGQFKWASGETSTYTNWYAGQPDNGGPNGEHYVVLNYGSSGKWNDYPNASFRGIIEITSSTPTITLAVSPNSVLENGSINILYTFTRTGVTTNALTVNYSIAGTAGSSDYTGATPGTGKTITFAAGASTATLTINPSADTTVENNETVALTLVSGTGYTVGTTTAVTGTIINDDSTFNYNNSTYLLTNLRTWQQAQAEAQSLGGNLVTINSQAEQNWLISTFGSSEELWIGLTDQVIEGQFKWASGETSTYTNWYAGQPDNGGPNGEHYVVLNYGSSGTWNDYPNAFFRGIIEITSSSIILIESAGNTKLVKDATNKYFAQIGTNTPIAIKQGVQIYENIYAGWQTLAAENVNGENQVIWKNASQDLVHLWRLDSNWNWLSTQVISGLNSAAALTQETVFGVDTNGDGVIGSPYTTIESAGNTKLVKDATNKYFAQIGTNTPIAIKQGVQIYENIYAGWQTLAAENVNGENQVIWKNASQDLVHLWRLDSNWNWLSTQVISGLNSAAALTQETVFGVDTNGDGAIGNPSSLTLTGTSGNDFLFGGANTDVLTGAGGKDTLTGSLGSDKFVYQNLTDSLLSNFDVITDFNATTGNDLFRVSTALSGFVDVGAVNTLDAAGIGAKLAAFGSNYAAQFSFGQKTFVAINDATAGFNAANDAIIEVTGLTGTLNVNNFVIV